MYWEKDSIAITTPTIPLLTIGMDYDVTLTLVTEAGDVFANAYLCCVNATDAGLLSAKKHDATVYRELGGLFDPECFLGYVPESVETSIDFRVNFPVGTTEGLRLIPVVIIYGDGAVGPSSVWRINLTPALADDIDNQPLAVDLWEI